MKNMIEPLILLVHDLEQLNEHLQALTNALVDNLMRQTPAPIEHTRQGHGTFEITSQEAVENGDTDFDVTTEKIPRPL